METLLQYVHDNWGKPQLCSQCSAPPVSFCGSCLQTTYCSANCQVSHWHENHHFQCIGGGVDDDDDDTDTEDRKRERDDDDDGLLLDDENPAPLKRVEVPVVTINDLSTDIWNYIATFLDAKDLKNLNAVQRDIQRKIRRTFFDRFRFLIDSNVLKDPHYKSIKPFVRKVFSYSTSPIKAAGKYVQDVNFYGTQTTLANMPRQITRMKIRGEPFNEVAQLLPSALQHLDMSGTSFNHPIDYLPLGLKTLNLEGTPFNWPIRKLPPELETLKLGKSYNQPIQPGVFPNSLRTLWFGMDFDQDVDHLLPPDLHALKIIGRFNKPLNALPVNLKGLHMETPLFNQPLVNLPQGLWRLVLLGTGAYAHSIKGLPNSIRQLRFESATSLNMADIPRGVELFIRINSYFPTVGNTSDLPPVLRTIAIRFNYGINVDSFPPTIRTFQNIGQLLIPEQLLKKYLFMINEANLARLKATLQ